MSSAQRPFLDQLQDAVGEWQREGLVSATQAQRILARYGIGGIAPATDGESSGRSRLTSIVTILGAVLVGVGLILFVASNWQRLDRFQRMALLMATLLAANTAGYLLGYSPGRYPRLGAAFIVLGTLAFAANIFLIGQIYHVPAGDPMLVALFAVGAAAVGYAASSIPSVYLAVLAAMIWYVLQLSAWHLETLGPLAIVGIASFIPYGLSFAGLGDIQRSYPRSVRYAAPFERIGLVVALGVVWLFTFADFWRGFSQMPARPSDGAQAAGALGPANTSFVIFSIAAVLLLFWSAHRRSAEPRLVAVQIVGALAIIASSLLAILRPFSDPAHYAIVFNALLLVAVLWTIAIGLWTHREAYINIGLLFFVLLAVARYFDFFFSFMDRSLAFIGAGLLLLGGGFLLERSRRRLLHTMREEASGDAPE